MKYLYSSGDCAKLSDDVVILPVTKANKVVGERLVAIDKAVGGSLASMYKNGEFGGRTGEMVAFNRPAGYKTARLVLLGLGEAGKLDTDCFRRAMGDLSRYQGLMRANGVAFCLHGYDDPSFAQAVAEGYLLGSYKHLDYKTGDDARPKGPKTFRFVTGSQTAVAATRKAVERGVIIAEGQNLVRRLAATPAGDLTPRIYAGQVKQLAKKHRFQCRVLDEKAIAREKMGALLGVAKGSNEPPRFFIMEHKGGRTGQKPVVLVGKGVTFDSGGISLKAGLNMHEMKQDMTGSAVVVATMVTAARLKLPLNIVGLVPATENMPSGHATRPGDILKSRKGKTIEIINTDAEGRLILADALDYANKYKPQAVIDIATLTGASLYILGYAGAPIMGNNDELLRRLETAADVTSEKVWRLPIWDEHRDQMKSSIADLVNSGGKTAGTIAAGAFLENFIGDWPWAHVDIAYMDMEVAGRPYVPKGASGYGLRLFIEMLSTWKKM